MGLRKTKAKSPKRQSNHPSSKDTNGNVASPINDRTVKSIVKLLEDDQFRELIQKEANSKYSKSLSKTFQKSPSEPNLKQVLNFIQQNYHQLTNDETFSKQQKSCLKTSKNLQTNRRVWFDLKKNENFFIPNRDTKEFKREWGIDEEEEGEESSENETDDDILDDVDSSDAQEGSDFLENDDDYSGEEDSDADSDHSSSDLHTINDQPLISKSILGAKRNIYDNQVSEPLFDLNQDSNPRKLSKTSLEHTTKPYSSSLNAKKLTTQAVGQEVLNQLRKEIQEAESKNEELSKEVEFYNELIQAQSDIEKKIQIRDNNSKILNQTNKALKQAQEELNQLKRVDVKKLVSVHSNQIEAIISNPSASKQSNISLLDTLIKLNASRDVRYDHFPQLTFKENQKRDIVPHPIDNSIYRMYTTLTSLSFDSFIPTKLDTAGHLAPDNPDRIASHLYKCNLKIPNGKFSFLIYLFLKNSQYDQEYVIYYPMLTESNKRSMNGLPSYLCEDIMFEAKELTNFLRRLLDCFYKPHNQIV